MLGAEKLSAMPGGRQVVLAFVEVFENRAGSVREAGWTRLPGAVVLGPSTRWH